MSTLNLYNVQKAGFWDELLKKERLQSLKAVNAIKTIRTQSAKTRPVNEKGELLPGCRLQLAKRRASDAGRPAYLQKPPILRMEPTIPNVTGKEYQRLKTAFRPSTAPAKAAAAAKQKEEVNQVCNHGTDPRFSSNVGPHLFGFSDIQKTFPVKDSEKANEYQSSDDYLDAMTLHDRKVYNPADAYKRPITAAQDIGWNAFDREFYTNRQQNKALIHPLKRSEMTKFADAMSMCGRR